jgi:plastocyanin
MTLALKRIVRACAAGAAVALAALAAPATAGGPLQIEFGEDFFAPGNPPSQSVSQSGDEVVWVGPDAEDEHNVNQDSRLFRSGPVNDIAEYHEDIAAGRYHYYCEAHGSLAGGMDGVVKIRPVALVSSGDSARVFWADSEAENGHRYRVEFRREGARKWKVWKRSTAKTRGEFGKGNAPVNANPNQEYQVRVRTFVKNQPSRRSGFSPVLTFGVAS